MWRIITLSIALSLLADFASAQNIDDMRVRLQDALQHNKTDLALEIASDLYEVSDGSNDHQTAGFSAYVKAGLFEQNSDPLAAAKAYDECHKHYDEIDSAAQAIQCQYKSALAFLAGHKNGQAVDTLKSTAESLEKIGQEKSALASQVYLTLATETLPAKVDGSRGAKRKRLGAVEYADKSLLALTASGQSSSEDYVSALFTKGLALEDAEEFDAAVETYAKAIALYTSRPNHSDDVLRNMRSRHSIAKFGTEDDTETDTLVVHLDNGEDISLRIEKSKKVKYPRINNNQMVDGARVRAKIQLSEGGDVDQIQILESMPSKEFGEAFKKAVRKWKFLPPEEYKAEDIPPFEYTMIFYVQRL
jgi:TonB family protein